jgi:hypothetical protein
MRIAFTKKYCVSRTITSASARVARRSAQVPYLEAAVRARGRRLDVVAEHQLVRLAHRHLGLVLVRAAGEREQLADPLEHAVRLGGGLHRHRGARGARVDPALGAHAPERLAVRRLVVGAQHLVDVLVRHLVLEHAEHLRPRPRDDEHARQLEQPRAAHPAAEPRRGVRERDHRRLQPIAEPLAVLGLVAEP